MVSPCRAIGESRRKFKDKALTQAWDVALKLPFFLRHVGRETLLGLVRDDSSRISARRIDQLESVINVEVASALVAKLLDFLVLDRVFVAIGTDTPHMQGEQLAVVAEGHDNPCIVATGGAQDLHHAAMMFNRMPVGGDGTDHLVQQHDSVGSRGVGRRGLTCRGTDPVGKVVLGCDRAARKTQKANKKEAR